MWFECVCICTVPHTKSVRVRVECARLLRLRAYVLMRVHVRTCSRVNGVSLSCGLLSSTAYLHQATCRAYRGTAGLSENFQISRSKCTGHWIWSIFCQKKSRKKQDVIFRQSIDRECALPFSHWCKSKTIFNVWISYHFASPMTTNRGTPSTHSWNTEPY